MHMQMLGPSCAVEEDFGGILDPGFPGASH